MDSQEQNQFSPSQNPPKPRAGYFVKGIAVILIVVAAYGIGYQVGRKGYIFVPKSFSVINQSSTSQTVDYSLLWDAINILNTKYEEIGVAVGRGQFQGHQTWLAVQEFGKPAASCPSTGSVFSHARQGSVTLRP